MTYALGSKSLANLARVHPDLVEVVKLAISMSEQDFGVTEPQVRTLEYQKQLVARGVSQTLKSNHLERVDYTGKTKTLYGHAVDLVPFVGGKFTWEWEYIWPIAAAMGAAAEHLRLNYQVCWGGVWDRWIGSIGKTAPQMKAAEQAYCSRHPGKDFVDGPHFQIGKMG